MIFADDDMFSLLVHFYSVWHICKLFYEVHNLVGEKSLFMQFYSCQYYFLMLQWNTTAGILKPYLWCFFWQSIFKIIRKWSFTHQTKKGLLTVNFQYLTTKFTEEMKLQVNLLHTTQKMPKEQVEYFSAYLV